MTLNFDWFDDGFLVFEDRDSFEKVGYKYSKTCYKYNIDDKDIEGFVNYESYIEEGYWEDYFDIDDDKKEEVLEAMLESIKSEGYNTLEEYYDKLMMETS